MIKQNQKKKKKQKKKSDKLLNLNLTNNDNNLLKNNNTNNNNEPVNNNISASDNSDEILTDRSNNEQETRIKVYNTDHIILKKENINKNNEERGRFPRTNYERRGYQTFYPRQGQFSNFKSYTQNINNQRTANFNPTNKPSTSELNKLLTNIDKNKNSNNNTDLPKFRNKIYLPQIKGVNLVGLLIGPQGVFQKLLEEKTGCKIYINGKNVKRRGAYVLPQDNDRAHVLIIGYSQEKVRNATQHLEKIIFADEETRNQIIQEESKVFQQSGEKNETTKSQDYLMTPHGPPGEKARFYKVPNDLVGLIIGANGETIRKIAMESNCKVLAGLAPIPNTQLRYIFIEGNEENYQIAVRMIEKIIGDNANKK